MGIELLHHLQTSRNLDNKYPSIQPRLIGREAYTKADSKSAEKASLLLEIMINQHVYAIAFRMLGPYMKHGGACHPVGAEKE